MAIRFQSDSLKQQQNFPARRPINMPGMNNLGIPMGSPQLPLVINNNTAIKPELPPLERPGAGLDVSISYSADYGGCGFWRLYAPELLINLNNLGVVHNSTKMIGDPRYYMGVKSVRLQRQATPPQLSFIKDFLLSGKKQLGFDVIYEVDDIIISEDIPNYNRCKTAFVDPVIRKSIIEMMSLVDEITVTCQFMKDYYIEKTGNKKVTIVPNYPMKMWLDRYYNINKLAENFEKNKNRPRIVCALSGTHFDVGNKTGQKDDYSHVIDAIIKARKDFKFIWVGAHPLKLSPFLRNGDMEYINWFPLVNLGEAYTKTNACVSFAALEDNIFNRAKSNIKLLEPACCGVPSVLQDMITYKDAIFKFSTGPELIDQFKSITKDIDTYLKCCQDSRAIADKNWLDDHIDEYKAIYFTKYGSEQRNKTSPNLIKNNPEQLFT